MPVVTRVSQATRPWASSVRTASRTASEIWSATLSGWPSVTDSEVNRNSRGDIGRQASDYSRTAAERPGEACLRPYLFKSFLGRVGAGHARPGTIASALVDRQKAGELDRVAVAR